MESLPIDPVIADTNDYEYEYHPSDTETFYLNLDLSSQPGAIRPPRRRTAPQSANTPANEDESMIESTETDYPLADHAQILGLHTSNPIVSYQNQIFSCTWADQIGTELFFATPDPEPDPSSDVQNPVLRRGRDFDLIAANSVKLLGRRAAPIPSTGAAPAQESTTHKTGSQTNQSRFLERLMDIKQARGETDQVRTVYSVRREQSATDRLGGWARTEEQLGEIQKLNDAALQGDADAIAALEELCVRIGSGDDHDDHNSQS